MRGTFSKPPKMILTLVPEVGADRQDGATESASPRLAIDVAVSGRQKTGALVVGELVLSATYNTRRYTRFANLSFWGAPAQNSMMCWRAWRKSDSCSHNDFRRPFQSGS